MAPPGDSSRPQTSSLQAVVNKTASQVPQSAQTAAPVKVMESKPEVKLSSLQQVVVQDPSHSAPHTKTSTSIKKEERQYQSEQKNPDTPSKFRKHSPSKKTHSPLKAASVSLSSSLEDFVDYADSFIERFSGVDIQQIPYHGKKVNFYQRLIFTSTSLGNLSIGAHNT